MYAEKEAGLKACVLPGDEYCIAAGCMAWRWVDLSRCPICCKSILDKCKHTPLERAPEFKGYCGLAGKPNG